MKEKLEIEDSFEEDEKDSEKQKNKTPVLNDSMKDINIKTIKTSLSIKFHDDEFCQNYQNRVAQMTKNILIRLTKISILLAFFTGIEFMGSYFTNSIGVLTISAVLFTDLIKFIITIISILIIENPANEIMTYGYFRSEIIASLCSMLIVFGSFIYLDFYKFYSKNTCS